MSKRPESERESLAVSRVFRVRKGSGWIASALGHGLVVAAVVFPFGSRPTATPRVLENAEVEFEQPPPPPPPPPPRAETPPPPPPPEPEPEPEPQHAPPPRAAAPPQHAAPAPRAVEAPHVLAAPGAGASNANAMAVGTNNNFHGGNVAQEPTPPEPPHEPPPREPPHVAPPPPPPPPAEVPDEELSVHPNIRCNAAAVANLYPEAAQDAELEANVAVEVQVDRTGRIVRAHARNDPGFGTAAAAERAVLTACRPTAVPRDRNGNEVGTRVITHIVWQLD